MTRTHRAYPAIAYKSCETTGRRSTSHCAVRLCGKHIFLVVSCLNKRFLRIRNFHNVWLNFSCCLSRQRTILLYCFFLVGLVLHHPAFEWEDAKLSVNRQKRTFDANCSVLAQRTPAVLAQSRETCHLACKGTHSNYACCVYPWSPDLATCMSEKHYIHTELPRRQTGMMRYRNSKLANVLFAYELNRKLCGSGVISNAVSPGFIPNTGAVTACTNVHRCLLPLGSFDMHTWARKPYCYETSVSQLIFMSRTHRRWLDYVSPVLQLCLVCVDVVKFVTLPVSYFLCIKIEICYNLTTILRMACVCQSLFDVLMLNFNAWPVYVSYCLMCTVYFLFHMPWWVKTWSK